MFLALRRLRSWATLLLAAVLVTVPTLGCSSPTTSSAGKPRPAPEETKQPKAPDPQRG